MKSISIILAGDSDISRWPPSLYPQVQNAAVSVENIGQSGASLSDLLPQLQTFRAAHPTPPIDAKSKDGSINIFIACAGENDISSGRSIDGLLKIFHSFLDDLFSNSTQHQLQSDNHLIFIGPKFEPWLSDEMSSRKQYTKLSNTLHRTIRKHSGFGADRMVFIDCLTMFCTEDTSTIPGAVHGGRALPDDKYFHEDGLHLSDEGYKVWKQIIEGAIVEILAKEDR